VLTYGVMVQQVVAAAETAGVDAEILDLRTLDLAGMDWAAIEASIRRTNRVLIVEQAARGSGHGARWAAEIQERMLDWLDAEVMRVSGSEAAPVVSRPLNLAALADATKVAAALRRLCPPRRAA
jgi:2-oxoisovalerate dehydrogenase E1 component